MYPFVSLSFCIKRTKFEQSLIIKYNLVSDRYYLEVVHLVGAYFELMLFADVLGCVSNQ